MAASKRAPVSTQHFLLGLISGAILVTALILAVYMVTSKSSLKSNVKAADCSTYTRGNAVRLGNGVVTAKDTDSFSYTPNLNTENPKAVVICGDTQIYNKGGTAMVYDQVKAGDKIDYITGFWGDTTYTTVLASLIYDSTQGNAFPQTITDNFTGLIVSGKKGPVAGFDTNKWQIIGDPNIQRVSIVQNGGTLNINIGSSIITRGWWGIGLMRKIVAGNDFDSFVDVPSFTITSKFGQPDADATAELRFLSSNYDYSNYFVARWRRTGTDSYVDMVGNNGGQAFDTSNEHKVPEGSKVRLHLNRTGNTIKGYATIGTGTEILLGTQTVAYTGSFQPQLINWKPSAGDIIISTSFDNFSVSGALQ